MRLGQISGVFAMAGMVRRAGLEAWLRNRPWRMVGLSTGVLELAVAFGAAAVPA